MVRVSLALGIIAMIAGLAAIGFGIPIQAFGLGNTLIVAGSTVFSAGLVVLTLSMVMRTIERAAEELRQPVTLEPSGSHLSFEHQPVRSPPSPVERPAAALPSTPERSPAGTTLPAHEEVTHRERQEPRRAPLPARPGWQEEAGESAPHPAVRPPGAPPPRETPVSDREASARPRLRGRIERAERPGRPQREPVVERAPPPELENRHERSAAADEEKDHGEGVPRVDPYAPPERRRFFGWTRRSKDRRDEIAENGREDTQPEFGVPPSAAVRAPQSAAEGREPPRLPLRSVAPDTRERPAPASPSAPAPPSVPEPREAAAEAAPEESPAVEILKQGTVDGMSYTLYTDGSIDAEFPDGKLRFNSIDELRQHLEAQQD